jgi:hypothetical protein
MIHIKLIRRAAAVVSVLLLWAPAASAQARIVGVVKDTTAAVLPGVTVEVASPALIEKVRSGVTDERGLYQVVDLRPGTYSVTFSLPGFKTVVRQGVELTGSFAATVNADMAVGGVEESITVSGESPLVDVHNVTQEKVLTKEIIAALPTSRTFVSLGAHVPALIVTGNTRPSGQDVGGSAGDSTHMLSVHGSRPREQQNVLDGMLMNNANGTSSTGVYVDMGAMEEINYQLGSVSAETRHGGVHIALVPKEGGNAFRGMFYGAYTNGRLQSDNTTDALRAKGILAANKMDKIWDVNQTFGGPMKKDKLWFFSSFRYWGLREQAAGMYYDRDPLDFVYTPDTSRPAFDPTYLWAITLRETWQVTPQHKLSGSFIQEGRCLCMTGVSLNKSPDASTRNQSPVAYLVQGMWKATLSNRLFLEAGVLSHGHEYRTRAQEDVLANPRLAVVELSTGMNFRAPAPGLTGFDAYTDNYKAAMSFVTGAHSAKFGFNIQNASLTRHQDYFGDTLLELLNGVPRSIQVFTTPYQYLMEGSALGVFAQDQWTMNRLTVTAGLRYDRHNSRNPAIQLPPVQFVGARNFDALENVPNWHDISPRLGASYDLFGSSRTAVKWSLSRYVSGEILRFAEANNPINTSVNSARRTWTDRNRDFVPQPDELGPLSDANFGKVLIRTRSDDEVKSGFGTRDHNWETSAGIQHQLLAGVSVYASYNRRWFGNFTATDNLLVSPSDYDPFCIAAPIDSRLPGGGGNSICGLFDINPSKFGLSNNVVRLAKNYGKQSEVFQGVDFSFNARLPLRGQLMGGVSTGRTAFDTCDVAGKVDNPATEVNLPGYVYSTNEPSPSLRFCHQDLPYLTQGKVSGSFPLPRQFQVSATVQSLPGPEIRARYVATNEQIRGSLGRNLAAGSTATRALQLVEPGAMYGERLLQLDLRASKIVRIRGARFQTNLDLYNAMNASPVLAMNNTYGPDWQRPTYVLPGRMVKFGAQIDF